MNRELVSRLYYSNWDVAAERSMQAVRNQERKDSHIFVPLINHIFYNTEKKTICIKWSNGEETKVTCSKDDEFDVDMGIRMAICKYVLGNSATISNGIISKAVQKAENTTKE